MDYRRRRLEERISQQLALALTVLAVVLVQTTLLPTPFYAPINILLVGMICWTIVDDVTQAALTGFYGGLTLDLLGSTMLGSHSIALLLVVWLTLIVIEWLPAENWMMSLILVGLLTPIYHLVVILFAGGPGAWLEWARVVVPPAILMNLLVTFPVLFVVRWRYERRKG